ncbi:glycoside hydrolase family 3 protein [Collybia nuda]|uniref:Glycoside hydrolase family 3 protein n=1 Tax=Collybia nuda TaxID=64659 RepID=A0A9P5XZ84_9AGAR|nr:glycoside hydrolase family 3 protein [Collybia nuda]
MTTSITEVTKREIGKHFVFGFHGHELNDDIKTLIKEYYLGNIILMKRNVRDVIQVRRIVRELQAFAKECGHQKPLLIGIDQENGLVSAFSSPTAGTQFPGAMALAATGSPDLAEEVSEASAKELKMVGINWAYSPIADVNSDPKNPVIGVRSFGDDPREVTRYALAVSRGLTTSGVAPSAKHFPGHGDTHVDSHLALPRILKSKQELEKTELMPFKALIKPNPIASVMVGHMALPLFTGDDSPASLSDKVTNGLLRKEMGYEGVVVTDCIEMDAIADPAQGGCGIEEGAVRALLSGVDVVMACHTYEKQVGAINRVYEALMAERLDLVTLEKGGERVDRMKDLFVGGWEAVLNSETDEAFEEKWEDMKNKNLALSIKAYRQSCALIWDSGILPLKVGREERLLLFTPKMESLNRAVDDADGVLRDRAGRLRNTVGASYLALAELIQEKTQCEHVVYSSSDSTVVPIQGHIEAVVFVLRNADRSMWQREYLKKVLMGCASIPVVLLASCGPYDLVGEDSERVRAGTAYVASFEFTRSAFEAIVEGIFDEKRTEWAKVPIVGGAL